MTSISDLEDQKDSYGDGRYDLTNTGGTIKFAQGCGYNNAAYFDFQQVMPTTTTSMSMTNESAFESGNHTTWFCRIKIYSQLDPDNKDGFWYHVAATHVNQINGIYTWRSAKGAS